LTFDNPDFIVPGYGWRYFSSVIARGVHIADFLAVRIHDENGDRVRGANLLCLHCLSVKHADDVTLFILKAVQSSGNNRARRSARKLDPSRSLAEGI
jgi:hypothetical protein